MWKTMQLKLMQIMMAQLMSFQSKEILLICLVTIGLIFWQILWIFSVIVQYNLPEAMEIPKNAKDWLCCMASSDLTNADL